jgi:signal transduction histidine kinase
VTFAEELERLRALHPDLEILLEGSPDEVPASLEALTQSILVEAIRNVYKHARASTVKVTLRCEHSTFVLEVRNDGAGARGEQNAPNRARPGGVGLRLATLEALQHDGVLEYGEPEPGAWQVRLVVPTGQ